MNDFWNQYDVDGNGFLSKEEFKVFLIDTFNEEDIMGEKSNETSQELIDAKYEKLFQEFDKNNDG